MLPRTLKTTALNVSGNVEVHLRQDRPTTDSAPGVNKESPLIVGNMFGLLVRAPCR